MAYIIKYEGIVWKRIREILTDYHLAEDAYQETVVRFLRYFSQLNTAVDVEVMCYLKAIANSVSVTIYRKHYKICILDEADMFDREDQTQHIEDIIVNQETRRIVLGLILKMDDMYSAPLLMYVRQEMSYKDIAKVLGISTDTARARVHRARVKLKAMYAKERGE